MEASLADIVNSRTVRASKQNKNGNVLSDGVYEGLSLGQASTVHERRKGIQLCVPRITCELSRNDFHFKKIDFKIKFIEFKCRPYMLKASEIEKYM